jgi:nitroreductase/dihydropteridine reductase
MSQIIEDLKWRYATKKYDTSKKISELDLDILKNVLALVPTSNGLQPFKFLIIEKQEIRSLLRDKSYGQSQVTDASHLVVMCAFKNIDSDFVENYLTLNSNHRNVPMENLAGFRNHLHRTVVDKSENEIFDANSKQVYIALGHLLHAAAQLRIDASPMEGFDANGYDEILGLSEKNLHATVVCALGYRSEEDAYQFQKKVRKSQEDLFEVI